MASSKPTEAIVKTIPGCVLWLDAADTSTIQKSGNSVTAWTDKSSNTYVSYSTTGRNPTSGTVTVNGLNTVQYVTGQTSIIDAFVLAQTMSIFQVYVPNGQASGSPFVEHGPDENSNPGLYFYSGGGLNYAINSGTGQVSINVGNTTINNTIQLLEGLNPDPTVSNTMAFYTNGTVRASGASQGGAGSSYTDNLTAFDGQPLGYNSPDQYNAPNTASPYYSGIIARGGERSAVLYNIPPNPATITCVGGHGRIVIGW